MSRWNVNENRNLIENSDLLNRKQEQIFFYCSTLFIYHSKQHSVPYHFHFPFRTHTRTTNYKLSLPYLFPYPLHNYPLAMHEKQFPNSRVVQVAQGKVQGRRLIYEGEKQVDAFQVFRCNIIFNILLLVYSSGHSIRSSSGWRTSVQGLSMNPHPWIF